MVKSPGEIMELNMSQTDEIVRLKLQVLQQTNFLQTAQGLLAQMNSERNWYRNEHGKCITLLAELYPRVLPPTKTMKSRMEKLLSSASHNPFSN